MRRSAGATPVAVPQSETDDSCNTGVLVTRYKDTELQSWNIMVLANAPKDRNTVVEHYGTD